MDRVRRRHASGRPAGAGDAGFTVIEVLVALALFAVLSSAVMAVVTDSLGLTRANESRVTAADLGNRVLEAARIADPTVAPVPSETVTVGGVGYTVTRSVGSVLQAGSSTRCGVSSDRTVAQRLRVGVDWPHRRSGQPPVSLSTVRTVDMNAVAPSSGTLYVVVEDADGAAVGGVAVTLAPTGATATSDTNGCAVFAAVAPRSDYVATIERAGYADPQAVIKPSRGPLAVTRGGTTEELFVYSPHTPESSPGSFTVGQTCTPDAVPAFGSAGAVATSGTSTAVAKPSGVMAGDFMIAQIVLGNAATPTAPAGWTLIDFLSDGSRLSQALYYRWATSSEANSYTWTHSSTKAVGGIAAYTGVHRKSPVNVVASAILPSGTKDKVAPSVTTTRDNARLVGFWSAFDSGRFSMPSTMTERYDVGSSDVRGATAGEPWPTAGSTGTRTAVTNDQARGIAHMVALAPTRTPSAASLSWTATSWPAAEGYYLRRTVGGLLQRDWSVTPRTATSSTDGPLINATGYVYELSAYAGSSLTDPVSVSFTPDC